MPTQNDDARSSRQHFIADDGEFCQIHPPKTRGQRHLGGAVDAIIMTL
jgi:hypothetical protein